MHQSISGKQEGRNRSTGSQFLEETEGRCLLSLDDTDVTLKGVEIKALQ